MNSLGKIFRISIYGESHGPEVGVIIENCTPGIKLTNECFKQDISRRAPGLPGTSSRLEKDIPEIKSGIYENKTTGAPLHIAFRNENIKPEDYEFDGFFRPGHADFAAHVKYRGNNDPRGGGQFSGRLTLPLVAAGVVAKKNIPEITISANIEEIGGSKDYEVLLKHTAAENDSLGGMLSCTIKNVPAGLGEPFFYGIEQAISAAVFSIPGVKAIEFGEGIKSAKMKGSEYNDLISDKTGRTLTNNSGGINGGISNGNDIVFKAYFRPSASIGKSQKTYNFKYKKMQDFTIKGRHDACFALRVPPVMEAVAALVIADLVKLSK